MLLTVARLLEKVEYATPKESSPVRPYLRRHVCPTHDGSYLLRLIPCFGSVFFHRCQALVKRPEKFGRDFLNFPLWHRSGGKFRTFALPGAFAIGKVVLPMT